MDTKITLRFNPGKEDTFFEKSGFVDGEVVTSEMAFISMNRRTYVQKLRENKLPPHYSVGIVLEDGVANYENAITTGISKEKFEAILKDIGCSLVVNTTYFSRYSDPSNVAGKIVTMHLSGVDLLKMYIELYFDDEASANEFREKKDPAHFGDELTDSTWAPEVFWQTTPHYEHKSNNDDGQQEDEVFHSFDEMIRHIAEQFGGSVKVVKLGEGSSPFDIRCAAAKTCKKAHSCQYGQWAFDEGMLRDNGNVAFSGKVHGEEDDTKSDGEDTIHGCHGDDCTQCPGCDGKDMDCGPCPGTVGDPELTGDAMVDAIRSVAAAIYDLRNTTEWGITQQKNENRRNERRINLTLKDIANRKLRLSKKTINALADAMGFKTLEEAKPMVAELRSCEGYCSGHKGMSKKKVKAYIKERVKKEVAESKFSLRNDMVNFIHRSMNVKGKGIESLKEEVLELQRAMAIVTPSLLALLNLIDNSDRGDALKKLLEEAKAATRVYDCQGTFWYPQEMEGTIFGEIAKEFKLDPQSTPHRPCKDADHECTCDGNCDKEDKK